MLLDLLRPTSGEIKIFGSDIRKNSFEIRQVIGYLPGEFAAYSHLSAIEYFKLIARIRKAEFDFNTSLIKRFDLSEKDLEKKPEHFLMVCCKNWASYRHSFMSLKLFNSG